MSREIWSAEDEERNECQLNWSDENHRWQWCMTDGVLFSGYPAIELNREDLVRLRDALNKELGDG